MIYGLTRIRNEANIIQDTLNHLAEFVDHIIVYDDASTDNTVELCKGHPKVLAVIASDAWKTDRAVEETNNREELLRIAKSYAEPEDWFIYIDADERIEFDKTILKDPNVDSIVMRLFDYYITEEDKDKSYTERKYIGPEYRNILMAYRNNITIGFRGLDQRYPVIRPKNQINLGYVKHYGKAVSIQQWENTCNYYSKYFPKYADKWRARKGKAIHTESDFKNPLILWEEKEEKGFLLKN